MDLLANIVNYEKLLSFFLNSSKLDVRLGSEYASVEIRTKKLVSKPSYTFLDLADILNLFWLFWLFAMLSKTLGPWD